MGYLTDQKHQEQYNNNQDNQYSNNNDDNDNNDNNDNNNLTRHNFCYYSNNNRQYICDAVSNAKYPWKVETLDERKLFKVINTTGNLYNNSKSSYSNFAFYESPYAYMKHNKIQLDDEIIQNWHKRVNNIEN